MENPESNDAEAYYTSGVHKYINKNFAGAILDFTKVIELKPDHGAAKSYLEIAILRMKENKNSKI